MASTKPQNDPRAAFERGEFREILQGHPSSTRDSATVGAIICSLASVGRWDEANAMARQRALELEPRDRARVRFVLAVEATRTSRFSTAARWLRENREDIQTKDFSEVRQGIAFHFYYRGVFDRAASWARRALKRSLREGNSYIRLLALELLAHSLVQTGQRQVGLRLLRESASQARGRESFELAEAIDSAVLRYEAEAGFRPQEILQELRDKIEKGAFEDIYSLSNLVLELARQLTLRGRWGEAKRLLDRESPRIYGFEERRLETVLQLRLAEIADRQGDEPALVHFLRSARRCLGRVADRHYELRILGLEAKWERDYRGGLSENVRARLAELSAAHPSRLNEQILFREGLAQEPETVPGEDPLFDLLRLLPSDRPRALSRLLEEGYLGLWPREAGLPAGAEALVVLDDGRVLSVSREGVNLSSEAWPNLPLRLLRRLSRGGADKQQLLEDVWGYRYDPIRHDSLIYSGLATLRRYLGEASVWIENRDEGWALRAGIVWRDEGRRRTDDAPMSVTAPAEDEDLNLRQIRALRELAKREAWDVRSYRADFEVSTMTAWRDLEGLRLKGVLRRVGHGRATRYIAASGGIP